MQCFVLNNCENSNIFVFIALHRSFPYFDVVVELGWSNDAESYACCSDATCMASHAREFKSDDPDKRGYHGPTGCGWGVRLFLTS
jgi:hypothetical protein